MDENKQNETEFSQNDRYQDQTSEFKLFRKGKKAVLVDEDDYSTLENTREFRNAISSNGKTVVRFNPKPDKGLTLDQVDERKKAGLVNDSKKKYGQSYLTIILKNIFTFFNNKFNFWGTNREIFLANIINFINSFINIIKEIIYKM